MSYRAEGPATATGLRVVRRPPHRPGIEADFLDVETPLFRAAVRTDCGILTSLVDRRTGRQLVAWGGRRGSDYTDHARPDLALNVFQLIEEHGHDMSAWQLQEVFRETSWITGGTTEVVEEGPVRIVLELRLPVESSLVTERITFYHDLSRVDFDVTIDWQEVGSRTGQLPNLKVAFTGAVGDPVAAWYETPFAAARRPANGQEVPALRWGDIGSDDYGIAVLNDGKYGYDALGNRLRLSLVRTGYDPDTRSDHGVQRARFALLPHPGSWRDAAVVQHAAGFNQPLLARIVGDEPDSPPPADRFQPRLQEGNAIVISSMKRSIDTGGSIVRLYESTGRPTAAVLENLPTGAVSEVNIVEDELRRFEPHGGSLTLAFRPWQVRTLLIRDDIGCAP